MERLSSNQFDRLATKRFVITEIVMPPTLKKLMGHIAFGASVSGCVGAWVTLFVPTVTFKPLKLES